MDKKNIYKKEFSSVIEGFLLGSIFGLIIIIIKYFLGVI